MDLVSRLKQYLELRGISVTQFSDICGVPRPTGSQLLAGRNKKVSDEMIARIHQAFPELSIVWLMFGEGEMIPASSKEAAPVAPEPTYNNMKLEDLHPSGFDEDTDRSQLYSDAGSGAEHRTEREYDNEEPNPHVPNVFTFGMEAHGGSPEGEKVSLTPAGPQSKSDSITLTPGKGKRVTGVVVYYDDSTFESFVPDPERGHPFLR